jgi:hypothetical protein
MGESSRAERALIGRRSPWAGTAKGTASLFGRRALAAAVLMVAIAGCSANTPTATGPTVTVTNEVATTVTGATQPPGTVQSAPSTPGPAGSPTSTSTSAGSLPALPDELAGLKTQDEILKAKATDDGSTKSSEAVMATAQRTRRLTEEAYSQAYGAPVEVQMYDSDDLEFLSTVIVVAAQSPGVVRGPVADPADLGLAVNINRVVKVGSVECEITTTTPVPAGKTVDPANETTTHCQRTGPGLTAIVYGIGHGTEGQGQMVDLTNAAWSAMGGS